MNKAKKFDKIIKTITIISSIVLLLSAGTAAFFYTKSKKASQNVHLNSQAIDLSQIASFTPNDQPVLPKEKPIIFPISNFAKLKDQPFFKDAKPDYQVYIYQQEKKAALFDPTTRKIIKIANLVIVTPTP